MLPWSCLSHKLTVSLGAAVFILAGGIAWEAADAAPPLAPVSGKVTYDDGALIPGDRIQLVFLPIAQAGEGEPRPRPSIADVNVKTGQFDRMSTFVEGDGATIGKHRIMITVLGRDGKLNGAVPKIFSDPATTPLMIEVENRRNSIHFQLPKPQPEP